MTTDTDPAASPFADLDRYVALPRLSGLALSPAGDQLVTVVSEPDRDGALYVTSLWSLDPSGVRPARRLTRADKGASSPAFAADGSLLFVSERPRPGGEDGDPAGVWRIDPAGGEPWPVAGHPGGVTAVAAARDAPVVVLAAKVATGQRSEADEAAWHASRAARKVTAVLHEALPVRQWDHERGPAAVHYLAAVLPAVGSGPDPLTGLRDLTPDAGRALDQAHPVVTADGTAVVTEWEVPLPGGRVRTDIVRIDVASGARTVLATEADGAWSYGSPAVAPDGRRVVCLGESRGSVEEPSVTAVFLLEDGGIRRLDVGDLWPAEVAWTTDGRAVLVTGALGGHQPLHRIDPGSGELTVLTGRGAWSAPTPAPDGSIHVLRSGMSSPPRPVRLAPSGPGPVAGEDVVVCPAPGAVDVPGRVEEVTATAADGTALRAWLVLPEGASPRTPAPLLLWIHGGPYGSWNDWSWRWNPWVMAARGWAVVLPDPAFSTGYGLDHIRRGWGQWGGNPYTDLMAVTDAAVAHPLVDGGRVAAMGGSYGGYMANWIAGHTDRFAAIVSHASIWSVEQFQATTDHPAVWADEWGRRRDRPDFYRRWSPDTYVDAITTPMLLIHGARDYRCPVTESVRMWSDLVERGVEAKFLSFPDENHWVLRPGDAAVWYETVLAFLDHHVLGRPWSRPDLL